MRFIVNGTELTNLEDLPPEARAKYERAMETMDKNRNGIPDFVEGMIGTAQQASTYQNTHRDTFPATSTDEHLTHYFTRYIQWLDTGTGKRLSAFPVCVGSRRSLVFLSSLGHKIIL
jgi:hypothetical protein